MGFASYLFNPRACDNCARAPDWRWYTVQIGYVALVTWLWYYPHPELSFLLSVVVCIYFGIVIVIDFEHRLILHPVSIVGASLGVWLGIILHGLVATLMGGIVGFLLMLLLYQGGRLFLRVLARWRNYADVDEALGFGDVVLAAVIGLMLGWPGVIIGLVLAILLAGVISLAYLIVLILARRYHSNLTIAYGPYLAVSAFLLLFLKDFFTYLF